LRIAKQLDIDLEKRHSKDEYVQNLNLAKENYLTTKLQY